MCGCLPSRAPEETAGPSRAALPASEPGGCPPVSPALHSAGGEAALRPEVPRHGAAGAEDELHSTRHQAVGGK
ncbi:unnamed protein product [Lampetra fluviatilis]